MAHLPHPQQTPDVVSFRDIGSRPKLLDRVRHVIRTRHYSPRAEDTYVHFASRTRPTASPGARRSAGQSRPFAGPMQVLQYLGRYTHRIALSNARLVTLVDGVVQFRWKDDADRSHTKTMALSVDEFLRRFLLHVLPRGFVRIRHFGLLANRHRRATIARAQQLLGTVTQAASSGDPPSADRDPTRCPLGRQGHWQVVEILRPLASPRAPLTPDTS
ncbi:MAG: transposase [Vicinamibacterales bacterium]